MRFGFRDRVPALNVGEFASIGLNVCGPAGHRVFAAELTIVLLKSPSQRPDTENGLWIGEETPSISVPHLELGQEFLPLQWGASLFFHDCREFRPG